MRSSVHGWFWAMQFKEGVSEGLKVGPKGASLDLCEAGSRMTRWGGWKCDGSGLGTAQGPLCGHLLPFLSHLQSCSISLITIYHIQCDNLRSTSLLTGIVSLMFPLTMVLIVQHLSLVIKSGHTVIH